jgi:hypothetical protein
VAGSLVSIFRQHDKEVFSAKWEILQVLEQEPGVFLLWIVVKERVLSVEVVMDREIYEAVETGPKPKKAPRERQQSLVKCEMPEAVFQAQLPKYECATAGHDIYELKVPLLFRMLTRLGNFCQPAPGVRPSAQNRVRSKDLYELTGELGYLSCINRLPLL